MSPAAQSPKYEVLAHSIAFDHEEFSQGDIIDEQTVGAMIYQLVKAGLVRQLPAKPPAVESADEP